MAQDETIAEPIGKVAFEPNSVLAVAPQAYPPRR